MENSVNQVEKNVCASFGYVKKDILMLNDSYTNMQEAVTQLARSYQVLGEEIKALKRELERNNKKPAVKRVFSKKATKKDVIKSLKSQHKKKTISKKDKLNLIEGIGPVIEKLLNKNKITTFKQLSNKKSSEIKSILDKAGPKFQMHDPTTWPRQAKLASESKWDELDKLQKELKGGIKVKSKKTSKKSSNKPTIKKVVEETKTTVFE